MADSELFDLPAPGPSTHGGSRAGAGRKVGSVNRFSREISHYLRSKHGEALEGAYEFCMRPVLSEAAELEALQKYLGGCSKLEAAEFWAKMVEKTLPYVYPRMAQIEMKPPGAPAPGLPFDFDGECSELTEIPDEAPADEATELAAPGDAAPQQQP